MSVLVYAGLSDPGRVRQRNEDRWLIDSSQGIFLVTDGMGGAFAGEWASTAVVQALPPMLNDQMRSFDDISCPLAKERICFVLAELSSALRAQSQGQPGLDGMGATVVLALIRNEKVLIAHMGDSRCYLFREGHLTCLTRDHTLVQLLLEAGDIKQEEIASHPAQGKLTRFVGMPGDPLPDASCLDLRMGDRLLLCTDGLTGMVQDEHLQVLLGANSPEKTCAQLVAAANKAGGTDNITVVTIAVEKKQGVANGTIVKKSQKKLRKRKRSSCNNHH